MESLFLLGVVIGLLISAAAAVVAFAIGRESGRAQERESLGASASTYSSEVRLDDSTVCELSEYVRPMHLGPDERMVPRFRGHGGAAMVLLLLAAGCAWPEPVVAQQQAPCLKRDVLIQQLGQKHSEQLAAIGLSARGTAVEIWRTHPGSQKDTWTLIESMPNGMACVRAIGTYWQSMGLREPVEEPAGFAP
jgi:hypothetical protein